MVVDDFVVVVHDEMIAVDWLSRMKLRNVQKQIPLNSGSDRKNCSENSPFILFEHPCQIGFQLLEPLETSALGVCGQRNTLKGKVLALQFIFLAT